mgnify:CR=1 FL=1
MAGRRVSPSPMPRPRRLQAQPSLASRFALHGGPKFSPEGRYVYFGSRDGWITKYDLWNLAVVAEMYSRSPILLFDRPAASSRSTSTSRSVSCWRGSPRPDIDRTTAAALRESNALSPAATARMARTSSVVSTSLTT